jgi:hypothetical protein
LDFNLKLYKPINTTPFSNLTWFFFPRHGLSRMYRSNNTECMYFRTSRKHACMRKKRDRPRLFFSCVRIGRAVISTAGQLDPSVAGPCQGHRTPLACPCPGRRPPLPRQPAVLPRSPPLGLGLSHPGFGRQTRWAAAPGALALVGRALSWQGLDPTPALRACWPVKALLLDRNSLVY